MARKIKWTPTIRKLLYEELLKRFGPYRLWGKGVPTGKEQEYKDFLEGFSQVVSFLSQQDTTSSAVQQQIAWATTCQESIPSTMSHNFIQNISVALETGFIESKELPGTILMERENPHKK